MSVQSTVELRTVPGFPGYMVGSDGSVWSCLRRGQHCFSPDPTRWRKLDGSRDKYGYVVVTVQQNGKRAVKKRVHELVLLAFIGTRQTGQQCCHENDIKSDNRLSNLRWGTRRDNALDSIRNGISKHFHILTEPQVREIRRLHGLGFKRQELADQFGVSYGCIRSIVTGKHWKGLM